jgi:hypothetical protein
LICLGIDSGEVDGDQSGVGMKIQTLFISRLTVAETGILFGISEQMFLLKTGLVVAQNGFRLPVNLCVIFRLEKPLRLSRNAKPI